MVHFKLELVQKAEMRASKYQNESAEKWQCLINIGMSNFGALFFHLFGTLVSAFGPRPPKPRKGMKE